MIVTQGGITQEIVITHKVTASEVTLTIDIDLIVKATLAVVLIHPNQTGVTTNSLQKLIQEAIATATLIVTVIVILNRIKLLFSTCWIQIKSWKRIKPIILRL